MSVFTTATKFVEAITGFVQNRADDRAEAVRRAIDAYEHDLEVYFDKPTKENRQRLDQSRQAANISDAQSEHDLRRVAGDKQRERAAEELHVGELARTAGMFDRLRFLLPPATQSEIATLLFQRYQPLSEAVAQISVDLRMLLDRYDDPTFATPERVPAAREALAAVGRAKHLVDKAKHYTTAIVGLFRGKLAGVPGCDKQLAEALAGLESLDLQKFFNEVQETAGEVRLPIRNLIGLPHIPRL